MSDMKDPDRHRERNALDLDGVGKKWNWILGGVGLLIVLILAIGYWGGESQQTAVSDTAPPATTGQSAPQPVPPPAGSSEPQPQEQSVPPEINPPSESPRPSSPQ